MTPTNPTASAKKPIAGLATDPVARFWAHRGVMIADSFEIGFQLFPQRALMTKPEDLGCWVLVGFEAVLEFIRPRQRVVDMAPDPVGWRVRLHMRSDASEIADRRLEAAARG